MNWQVPGSALINGLNRLSLEWAYAVPPRDVVAGDRAIGTTGVELPIDVDLKAFADGGFIALFDEEGEQTDASAGRRGVNVAVLDPETGEVISSVVLTPQATPTRATRWPTILDRLSLVSQCWSPAAVMPAPS